MSVGDGMNDHLMLSNADVGVRVCRDLATSKDAATDDRGDIVITEFPQLRSLILSHGYHIYTQISRTIFIYFYSNCILVAIEILW